jgi:hypothetical protein
MSKGTSKIVNVCILLSGRPCQPSSTNKAWCRNSTYQLLIKRNLLKLHAMDAGRGGSQQRSCCDDQVGLHRVKSSLVRQ